LKIKQRLEKKDPTIQVKKLGKTEEQNASFVRLRANKALK